MIRPSRRRRTLLAALASVPLVLLPVLAVQTVGVPAAQAHPERLTAFPPPEVCYGGAPCTVPAFRRSGPTLVVCKPDSESRLRAQFPAGSAQLDDRLALLKGCRFRHLQSAVDAAGNGTRIVVMPGLYREEPSRAVPHIPTRCSDESTYFDVTEGYTDAPPPAGPRSNDPPIRPNYRFQHDCPNAQNLVIVLGDSNGDRKCDAKCNIQIQGAGRTPADVILQGDRVKMDVLRADRADGFAVRNILVQEAAFNGVDVVETNGFHVNAVVARWNQNYGVLSFTSDHGLYDTIKAYGNGDSGVYPGSAAKGCDATKVQRYTTELRNIDSFRNVLGYSGTAGNSTWIHDSTFRDNATGISTDSFAAGHPGMPQECVKWERNKIHSNNFHLFSPSNQQYCADTPFAKRPIGRVCPQFQVPEGSGVIMYGANRDLVRYNWIYDNWRSGLRLFTVPASVRGDNNPEDQQDTSNNNVVTANQFGKSPAGAVLPNGFDITWDGGGQGNCWAGNKGARGDAITSEHQDLPTCPGSPVWLPPRGDVSGPEVACAAWDPVKQQDPPGCDWFVLPPKPSA